MQIETFDDAVEVEAHFGQHGMRPVWFAWQGRRRTIRQVTSAWNERDGLLVHRCFAVTDEANAYELRFDVRALRWSLTRVALTG